VDQLKDSNPGFKQITRLCELDDGEFVERNQRRPVGCSANARLRMGRLAVPMLLDSGATCAIPTEDQAVLLVKRCAKKFEDGARTQNDYNYPIAQLYRYKRARKMRGAEEESETAVEFAICSRVEFGPEGATRGVVRGIYFKIFKAGACDVVRGRVGLAQLGCLCSGAWGRAWMADPF
jgi:hypothetical protein